jgi:hypothetical protein
MDQESVDIGSVIRQAIAEYAKAEQVKSEPAYKAELIEERRRREQLEHRVNELVEENRRSRQQADEAQRASAIRAELQRLGVQKIDLAFRAVKDDIARTEDGRLVGRSEQGDLGLREFLTHFVTDNPELLPARMSGGSGTGNGQRVSPQGGGIELDKLRPGMSPEELDRIRQEISRVASQTLRGM